jgi:4-hydroxy-tetrahydrodipicolinate synthase
MKLHGVLPVLHLPYCDDYSIDYDTLRREVEWALGHGVHGLTLAMATEVFRLTDEERADLFARTVEFASGQAPVIASVGGESTLQAVRHTEAANRAGASGLMAIPPALTRCNSDEVVAYFEAILAATDLPLVLQDASGYVGNAIPIETQGALHRAHPGRILFKPEALPFGPTISAIRDAAGEGAIVFEGTGGIALVESYARGVQGTMGGTDLCWALIALWNALETGDDERARRIHEPLATLISMLHNLDAFICVEKFLLRHQGIFSNELVRRPVGYHMDEQTRTELLHLFARIQKECTT